MTHVPELEAIDYSRTWQLVENQALLLTSTNRLARHLSQKYAQHQLRSGKQAWESPGILPLSTWLARSLDRAQELKPRPMYLLDPEQEKTLWEEIIRESHSTPDLIMGTEIAESASQAWYIQHRHHIPDEEISSWDSPETRAYLDWSSSYLRTCQHENLMDSARLPGLIRDLAERGELEFPDHVVLAGFYELEPALRDLLLALQNQGTRLYHLEREQIPDLELHQAPLPDNEAEIREATWWARSILRENPEARIGIVVPGLEGMREKVLTTFEQVLHPEAALSPQESPERAFNISLGEPLSQQPLIRCALLLLDLLSSRKIEIRNLSAILRSPFIQGWDQEYPARAKLDLKLRENTTGQVPQSRLLSWMSRPDRSYYTPVLKSHLDQAQETGNQLPPFQSPAAWARDFSRLLEEAGWPLGRSLNSLEYQAFHSLGEVLTQLGRLGKVLPKISFFAALQRLKRLLSSRIFQPETREVPVQILGFFEIAGLDFDYLRILNLHSETLPAPARPNPLLPGPVQHKHSTPGASPQRELELARKLIQEFQRSAPWILFTYPRQELDRQLQPTPLLAEITTREQEPDAASSPGWSWEPAHLPGLEEIQDPYGAPLQERDLAGGTRVFKDQALCPFRGYAGHRLDISEPQEPMFGASPVLRGEMVHYSLMLAWQEISSWEELLEMQEQGSLAQMISGAVQMAVDHAAEQGVYFSPEFLRLERTRLESLLLGWLETETQREPFDIYALESRESISIGPLRIRVRLDRIDEIRDQGLIIMDYKTGAQMESLEKIWFGERILEPQLPIYAQAWPKQVAGLILAQVNPKKFSYTGLVRDQESRALCPDDKSKLKTPQDLDYPDLAELFGTWKERLKNISHEIRDGRGDVTPLENHEELACRYCGLKQLCRINE